MALTMVDPVFQRTYYARKKWKLEDARWKIISSAVT